MLDKKMKKNKKLIGYRTSRIITNTINHLLLIIISFMMIFPFLWMAIASFKPNIDIISPEFRLFSSNWTLGNYVRVIRDMPIDIAFLNSFLVATIVTVSVIYTSSAAGFLFSKFRFKGKDALFFLTIASVMIPPQIVLIPLYFMISQLGLVNTYMGLVIPFLMQAFSIFLMRQFIFGIPTDLIEAARMDGASDWRIYFKIILPLIKSSIAIVGILTFLWTYDEFLWPLVVVTSEEKSVLPLILSRYAMAEAGVIAGPSMATASLVLFPIILAYSFFQRYFVKSLSMTGIKG